MKALTRLLPADPRARKALLAVLTTVVLLLVTQLGFSGGTSAAILFAGLCVGAATAVTASGIVLLYRTLRIINFSQVALGVAGAILTFELIQFTPVPFPVAFLLGVGLSALLGAVIGTVTLRFFSGSRLFLTVVTIVAASTLASLAVTVRNLPFFPPQNERTSATLEASQSSKDLLPFSGFDFQVGSFRDFGFPHVFALEMAVLVFLALGVFFRFTGTAVRGLAENAERASLLGIGVGGLSVLVWGLAGALGGIGVILNAGLSSPNVATGVGFGVLLPALAAAVLARMTSLPVAVFAAVTLGVFHAAFEDAFQSDTGLFDVALFAIIATGLLLQRLAGRSEVGGGVAWSASDEPRAIPRELRDIVGIRVARLALIGFLGLTVAVFPFVASTQQTVLLGVVALNAIAVVSLVVLTGWAGQVSLAQFFAFVAIGSVVGGAITASTPIPFWFAVPLAAAVTGAIAVLVGLPALRIQGLFLLVATFAFAVVVREILFSERYFGWLLPDAVDRPTFFFVDFDNERAMYFLCMASLAVAIVIVTNLRRSRVGRVLIAIRENEANAQAFGVSALRMKLVAFGISGALCGFAGAVFAAHQRGIAADSFGADAGVGVFIAAVFGGVGSVTGALLGATYFRLTEDIFTGDILQAVLQQGGTLYLLFLAPGGLISLLVKARDSVLRVVAQRRQLVVPSLFADTPPEALEQRLIPLGASDGSAGLAALPPEQRYVLGSELYRGKGGRILGKLAPARRGSDADAIGAAAARADDVDGRPVLSGSLG